MRVLLCAPPLEDLDARDRKGHLRASPNLGLYLLCGVLEEHGYEVRLIDPVDFEGAFVDAETSARTVSDVDVLAVSINSCTWPRALRMLAGLEESGKRPLTVVGGPHASIMDQHLARSAPLDYVVRGEGERSFPALLEALHKGTDPAEVPGVTFLRDNEVVSSAPGPLLTPEELAGLPLPRFELMPDGYYDLIPVETSRGCFHACVFCSVSFRRNWRGLSSGVVADRISKLSGHLGRTTRDAFFIIDDCFTADHDRFARISGELAGMSNQVCFEARITDVIEPGMIQSVKRLPVGVMEMGVECGYDEGLAKVGKKLTLDQVTQAADLIRGNGLGEQARFSFVMGLPWETRKEVFKTLEYAFKLTGRLGSRLIASWLTVFPGSMIWKRRDEWKIDISEGDYDRELWWRQWDTFRRTHPRLDADKDFDAVLTYIKLLMELFPTVRHDGFFKWLKP